MKIENDEEGLVIHIGYFTVVVLILSTLIIGIISLAYVLLDIIALLYPFGNEAALYLTKTTVTAGYGALLIVLAYLAGRSLLYRRRKNAV